MDPIASPNLNYSEAGVQRKSIYCVEMVNHITGVEQLCTDQIASN